MIASRVLRLVIALAGAVLVVIPEHAHVVPVVLTLVGAALAVALPGRVGEVVLLGAFLLSWTSAIGWHATPSIWRTVVAVGAVCAVHVATSVAAFVPFGARIERGLLAGYLRGMIMPAAAGVVLVVADLALPRGDGPALVELAGALGLAALAIVVGTLSRGD